MPIYEANRHIPTDTACQHYDAISPEEQMTFRCLSGFIEQTWAAYNSATV